ncbi:hypothetical protein DLM45_11820 [Hyphomicrobium methylovorum]|uniref:DUF7282 domain-containing protein n=1 Tax=Hyphomicrobium methylovorum TaxID=84 RepID=UPI0015E6A59C|nr:hypothetical protein [Hyphomicrobium methylovorum]MBA2126901.1 hypothetical protein [Hyphomicrobium methylovorum]
MPARLIVSVFALAVTASSFTQPASAMQESAVDAAKTPASVIVMDQKLDRPEVNVSYVFAPENAFAVVYGKGDNAKSVLGSIAVAAGDHRDVKIPISENAKAGDELWISVYRAKDDSKTFDRESATPYWTAENLPSTNGFVVR